MVTFRVSRPRCILVGFGVTERSLRLRLGDSDLDLDRLRTSLSFSTEPRESRLFSLSLSRSELRRSRSRSFDFGLIGFTSLLGAFLTGERLRDLDRETDLRFGLDLSAPLLEDEDEEDDELDELLRLLLELLLDERLEELKIFNLIDFFQKRLFIPFTFHYHYRCCWNCVFSYPFRGLVLVSFHRLKPIDFWISP